MDESEYLQSSCSLMTPDIVEIHPDVFRVMHASELSEKESGLEAVTAETMAMLQVLLQTANAFSFTESGMFRSGTELLAEKLLRHSDTVLVPVYGGEGRRLASRLESSGADVMTMEREWGYVFDPDEVVMEMKKRRPAMLALVHGDMSTGKMQRLEEIGKACRELDILLLVDVGATSGSVPLRVDDWLVDAIAGSPGKCLCIPELIEQISYNERVEARLAGRRWSIRGHETRKREERRGGAKGMYGSGDARETLRGLLGLREGLSLLLREGLEARQARQRKHIAALEAGLEAMGLAPFGSAGDRLPMMTAVRVPEGMSGTAIRRKLLYRGIAIAGSPEGMSADIWRLAVIGGGVGRNSVETALAQLELAMIEEGARLERGTAARAAEQLYNEQ